MKEKRLNKITELRNQFDTYGITAYVIPSNDEFLNEYVPRQFRRLEYITGFTGSNGIAIITKDKLAFYTDGRYLLQAQQELDSDFSVLDMYERKSCEWFDIGLNNGDILGYDPMLHSKKNLEYYEKLTKQYNYQLKPVPNLVDKIWQNRPASGTKKAFNLGVEFSGRSSTDKIADITSQLQADYLLLCNPDSICWLLNIRAHDIEYTPVLLSYLMLSKSGAITLFSDPSKTSDIQAEVKPWNSAQDFFTKLLKEGKSIQVDPAKTPVWFTSHQTQLVLATDPCELPKAKKNAVEIQGMRDCHETDGKAVTNFLKWLKENYQSGVDEIKAAEKLLEFRKQGEHFVEPSFESISAFAENAAVIHYRATPKTNKQITGDNLYLIDSGGQYLTGTTDITRTICLGSPKREHIENYTLVLKGHIAIASAIFPVGTTGAQLDALARQYLWRFGRNYMHGTGHGVGHFLSVHEGPQGISKLNTTVLEPDMIISNEPGYYKEGEYGIRLENLVLVKQSSFKGFLELETITLVPFEDALIDLSMLETHEKKWLRNYSSLVNQF